MYQRPLYFLWVQGNHLIEVTPTGWNGSLAFDARGDRYSQALQDLLQKFRQQTSMSYIPTRFTEKAPAPGGTPRNPYKGLQAFGLEDAQDFFGQDRLVADLLAKVEYLLGSNQQGNAPSRLLTVLGPSGSGKSSVVMAGLLPKLQRGELAGSQHWIYLDVIVPGTHPLEALALTLTPLFPQLSPGSLLRDLQDDAARGLHMLLASYVKQSGKRVILVVDQFEELFTQTATEEERQCFLDLLLTAATEPHGSLFALLTLRADFYDRPLLYPELGRLIEAQHLTTYPLSMRDLRAVIEQPAQLPDVQLIFEEDLVGDLLFEVQNQVGALPLLQFALDQLFQQRRGHLLTQHVYWDIGGVGGALAKHAESIYQSLPTPSHQRLVRALFLRLINPGTMELDATKRRIPFTELVVADPGETVQLAEVTETFTRARLLTANTIGGVSTIEVSHEAVLRAWPRLREWFHEAREDIRIQQAISENAAHWRGHGRVSDWLYRGSQLTEALQWRVTNLPSLEEADFLQVSLEEHQRRQDAERRLRLKYTRRTILIGTIGVVGMAGIGFFALKSPGELILPTPVPRSLPYSYTLHTSTVESVAWSPDGRRIASAGDDTTVLVWEPTTGNTLLTYTKHSTFVESAA
jgi:hypothetical protein